MPISDLPVDILNRVIFLGSLEIQDIINLSLTCKSLSQSRNGYAWKTIYDHHWGNVLNDYELYSENYVPYTSWHDLSMQMFKKQKKLASRLSKYSPRGTTNIGVFLDKFANDNHYIPILQNLFEKLVDKSESEFVSLGGSIDISKLSLLVNLIKAQTVRIAIEHLTPISVCSEPSAFRVEAICFRIALLMGPNPNLVRNRTIKLQQIRNTLRRNLRPELELQKFKSFTLMNGMKEDILTFKDSRAFKLFVKRVIETCYSHFSIKTTTQMPHCPSDVDTYNPYDYFEDFNILSLYSDISKGSSFVVMAILGRVIEEFLSDFHIVINEKRVTNCRVTLTKSFIRIGDILCLLRPTYVSGRCYEIEVFTVKEFLLVLARMNRLNERNSYIDPVNEKYVVDYFKDMNVFHSLSNFYKENYSAELWLRPNSAFVSPDDFMFAKVLCHLIAGQYERESSEIDYVYDGKDLKQVLLKSNNFIHLNTIYQNFGKYQPSLVEHLKLSKGIPSSHFFAKGIDLLDNTDGVISFQKVRENTCPCLSSSILNGQAIFHSRTCEPAIILGSKQDEPDLLFTLLNNGHYSIYRSESVKLTRFPVGDITLFRQLLGAIRLDILGLLYFEGIELYGEFIRFYPIGY